MLAARLYGPGDIRLDEVPMPDISEREILVKVRSAGICGTDMRMIKNGFAGITAESPRTLGHELSGEIVEVGSHTTGYQVGMRVGIAPNMGCGICAECIRGNQHLCASYEALGVQMDGGFAEYVRVPEQALRFGNVVELPAQVTFDHAAVNEPLSCVYNGIEQCPIRAGDDVLIIGAGPIGIMYAQLAKMSGAGRVFLSNRSTGRLELARRIDPSFIALPADGLKESLLAQTGGRGADVIVTANPSPEAQQLAVELAAMGGRINFFGGLPKDSVPVALDTNVIHYKQLLVTGSTKANNAHFRKTLQFIASGILDVGKLVSARYAIGRFDEALRHAGSSQGIKTVIAFD
ncbi:alcohol dehydrogenase catalytic domain-containing protein [Cohnella sp. GCM10012308]|uniref:alcohol dehydrogenase catalytic domain-containing protein n=1 Tax=Cohnella sp. GCM10012308 TaxID=3317329 RepID=UPI0036182BF3